MFRIVVALVTVGLSVGPSAARAESPTIPDPAGPLRLHTERVSAAAVERGLERRVGTRWRAWTIDIEPGDGPSTVDVQLREPDGTTHRRELVLLAPDTEARSRELASALALLIDSLPESQTAAAGSRGPSTASAPTPATGWIGLGPRTALNLRRPVDPEGGLSLTGGTWQGRDHLQPVAELAWSRTQRGELRLDGVRLGAGLLAGARVGPRLWSGGGVLARAAWSRAASTGLDTVWGVSASVVGVVQYRGRILVAGTWLGLDINAPPLRAFDGRDSIRWATARPTVALQVGLRLPPQRAP